MNSVIAEIGKKELKTTFRSKSIIIPLLMGIGIPLFAGLFVTLQLAAEGSELIYAPLLFLQVLPAVIINNSYSSSNRSGYTYTDHIAGNRATLSDVCYLHDYRGDIKISEFCSCRRRCSFIYSYDSNSGCFFTLFFLANVASNEPTRNAGNANTHHCRTRVCNLFHCYKMVQQGEVSNWSLMEIKS
jgi:hypothetical protein